MTLAATSGLGALYQKTTQETHNRVGTGQTFAPDQSDICSPRKLQDPKLEQTNSKLDETWTLANSSHNQHIHKKSPEKSNIDEAKLLETTRPKAQTLSESKTKTPIWQGKTGATRFPKPVPQDFSNAKTQGKTSATGFENQCHRIFPRSLENLRKHQNQSKLTRNAIKINPSLV
jgi:hypothetical protein